MNYDDFLELTKNRRSCRRFKPDPVPDEYVDKIIEAARWAPSGFNMQPWEFIVIKEHKIKNRIVEMVKDQRRQAAVLEQIREEWQLSGQPKSSSATLGGDDFAIAPVFILLLGDPRTNAGLPMSVRCDYDTAQFTVNAGLANAFLYMHLAATALGLASQWMSIVRVSSVECMLKDFIGIPGYMRIFDMMVLGYPAVEPNPKLMRPADKMVHHDYCSEGDFRTENEVKDFIKRCRAWTMAQH